MKKIVTTMVVLLVFIIAGMGTFVQHTGIKADAKQREYGKQIKPEVLNYLEEKKGYRSYDIEKAKIIVDKKRTDKHSVQIAITFSDDKNHVYYYSKDREGEIYQSGATGEKHFEK